MKVLQIVGYKNTGKTTLMVEFLKDLKIRRKKVMVIKHHHLDFEHGKTDTALFLEHVEEVVLNTPSMVYRYQNIEPSLSAQIEQAKNEDYDYVLIEGYKNEKYEKVVLLKTLKHLDTNKENEVLNLINVVAEFDLNTDFERAVHWFKDWSK